MPHGPENAIGTTRVEWAEAWRIIASRYPPIDLFERVLDDPAVWDVLIELEQLTNPRVRDEVGTISLVPPERAGIPDADRFGVVYVGSTLKVCFLETILRDRGNGRLGDWLVELTELDAWSCAEIAVEAPLRLVELRGDASARMGIPSDALRASSHGLGQAWSAALWSHDELPDGLIYSSRLNEDTNVVVYDCALPKLKATATPRLLECRSELASVLRDLAVALI